MSPPGALVRGHQSAGLLFVSSLGKHLNCCCRYCICQVLRLRGCIVFVFRIWRRTEGKRSLATSTIRLVCPNVFASLTQFTKLCRTNVGFSCVFSRAKTNRKGDNSLVSDECWSVIISMSFRSIVSSR